ncbi:cysteine desulfurase family protein [Psychrobacter sp. ANT_WB68]|uniref:cysteine desulfurase family protein n=1 Tax=Psychrobacter sp. ANT_WB68 TaxID=2597355 RepID=UPI0011F1FF5D|nr:aminotransferase class V-fold PLP-dependent enzyme [Psychrobacter sp. ANT_WB68]KAA0915582.1 aminotransferase class V-fold PLP-dependent enzyme [Psychrobacter sp. ANT_WB68]
MKNIYLDYNSHTPCDISVIKAMQDIWSQPGNPHSDGHSFGWNKQTLVSDSLTTFANIYGCFEEELLFTSGATEANNLAIYSGIPIAERMSPQADTILTSHLEHKSVLNPLEIAASKHGLKLLYVDIKSDGVIDLKDMQTKFEQNKVLWVSCTMTNGVIGTNQPIYQVAELCRRYNAMLHVDASQAGYLDIICHDLEVDFLTLSAHKVYGPSGIGLFYSKHLQHPEFMPMISGGGQQDGLRAGTLPVPLIVGFAEAARVLDECKESEALRLRELRDTLLNGLNQALTVRVFGDLDERHPGNLYLAIENIDSMQLLNNVQPHIAFSLGSACDGLNREYSPIMKAMSVPKEVAECTFRICIGRMTTVQDIHKAVEILIAEAKRLS